MMESCYGVCGMEHDYLITGVWVAIFEWGRNHMHTFWLLVVVGRTFKRVLTSHLCLFIQGMMTTVHSSKSS